MTGEVDICRKLLEADVSDKKYFMIEWPELEFSKASQVMFCI